MRRGSSQIAWHIIGRASSFSCYCHCDLADCAVRTAICDSPEPVDYQHWEFYIASQHIKTSDGWSGTAPHVEVNYGAIKNLQLHLIAPSLMTRRERHYRITGLATPRSAQSNGSSRKRNIYRELEFFRCLEVPTGSESAGLGSGHVQAFLPVWLQKSWGEGDRKWTAYGGGGYHINPVYRQPWKEKLRLVLQRQITDRVLLGGEIYHRTATTIDLQADTAFNLGTGVAYDI